MNFVTGLAATGVAAAGFGAAGFAVAAGLGWGFDAGGPGGRLGGGPPPGGPTAPPVRVGAAGRPDAEAGAPLVSGVAAGRPVRSCSARRGSSMARCNSAARSGVSADLRHVNATTSLISGATSKRTIAVCESTVSTFPVAPTG